MFRTPAVHDVFCFGPPRSTTDVFRTPALHDGCVSDPRALRRSCFGARGPTTVSASYDVCMFVYIYKFCHRLYQKSMNYTLFVSDPRAPRRMCFGPPRSTTDVFRTPALHDGHVSGPGALRRSCPGARGPTTVMFRGPGPRDGYAFYDVCIFV
jgi:hypothetical protein